MSFLGALLLVSSLLLVAGMIVGVVGPLAGPARDRVAPATPYGHWDVATLVVRAAA